MSSDSFALYIANSGHAKSGLTCFQLQRACSALRVPCHKLGLERHPKLKLARTDLLSGTCRWCPGHGLRPSLVTACRRF